MKEIKNVDGTVQVYSEYTIKDDNVKIDDVNIVVSMYGVNIDVTKEIMYALNRAYKSKKLMMDDIKREIEDEEFSD